MVVYFIRLVLGVNTHINSTIQGQVKYNNRENLSNQTNKQKQSRYNF